MLFIWLPCKTTMTWKDLYLVYGRTLDVELTTILIHIFLLILFVIFFHGSCCSGMAKCWSEACHYLSLSLEFLGYHAGFLNYFLRLNVANSTNVSTKLRSALCISVAFRHSDELPKLTAACESSWRPHKVFSYVIFVMFSISFCVLADFQVYRWLHVPANGMCDITCLPKVSIRYPEKIVSNANFFKKIKNNNAYVSSFPFEF